MLEQEEDSETPEKRETEVQENRKMVSRILNGQKSRTNLNLSSRRKSVEQLQQYFSHLKQDSTTKSIKLDWNLQPNIILMVSIPRFSVLKSLNLGSNNICTLEPLVSLRADNLEEIFLWGNKITDLRSLRKCRFTKLRFIDVSKNKIAELGKIGEINSGKLEWVNIDYNHVGSLVGVCKIQNFMFSGKLLASSNQVVAAFGSLAHKGRLIAMDFSFQNNLAPKINYF